MHFHYQIDRSQTFVLSQQTVRGGAAMYWQNPVYIKFIIVGVVPISDCCLVQSLYALLIKLLHESWTRYYVTYQLQLPATIKCHWHEWYLISGWDEGVLMALTLKFSGILLRSPQSFWIPSFDSLKLIQNKTKQKLRKQNKTKQTKTLPKALIYLSCWATSLLYKWFLKYVSKGRLAWFWEISNYDSR